MSNDRHSKIQGEGNYEAARRYREKSEEFAESGKVEEAARKAGDVSDQQRSEMEKAEEEGRSRAKETERTKRED